MSVMQFDINLILICGNNHSNRLVALNKRQLYDRQSLIISTTAGRGLYGYYKLFFIIARPSETVYQIDHIKHYVLKVLRPLHSNWKA